MRTKGAGTLARQGNIRTGNKGRLKPERTGGNSIEKTNRENGKIPSEKTLTTPPSDHKADGVTLPSNGISANKYTKKSETSNNSEEKSSEYEDVLKQAKSIAEDTKKQCP